MRVTREGWCWSRLFSDREWGGKRLSLAKAVEHRDALLRFLSRAL